VPTALDLFTLALFDAGVVGTGQAATGQDIELCRQRFNYMLGEWNHNRWFVRHLQDLSVVSTGAQSYTVGPAGDINTPDAPDRLEAAFFRQLVQSTPNQIDYPCRVLQSREDYNLIALKQLQSFPMNVFYDSDYPLGRVYFWPIAQPNIYELHITVKAILSDIAANAMNVALVLPKEYFSAIHWNLVVRLRAGYDLPPRPDFIGLAKNALNIMRKANTQIAALQMPTDLARPGIYNPYSDQVR
jgi:hypothetical protein